MTELRENRESEIQVQGDQSFFFLTPSRLVPEGSCSPLHGSLAALSSGEKTKENLWDQGSNWFAILPKVAKISFFQTITYFTIFNSILQLKIIWPKSSTVVNRKSLLHYLTIMLELPHNYPDWLLDTLPNGTNDIQILDFFGDEFLK